MFWSVTLVVTMLFLCSVAPNVLVDLFGFRSRAPVREIQVPQARNLSKTTENSQNCPPANLLEDKNSKKRAHITQEYIWGYFLSFCLQGILRVGHFEGVLVVFDKFRAWGIWISLSLAPWIATFGACSSLRRRAVEKRPSFCSSPLWGRHLALRRARPSRLQCLIAANVPLSTISLPKQFSPGMFPGNSTPLLQAKYSGKDPLCCSACADCPGFLVLGAAPAPASTLVSEPQIVPLG